MYQDNQNLLGVKHSTPSFSVSVWGGIEKGSYILLDRWNKIKRRTTKFVGIMTKLLTSSQNFTHKKETMIYPFPVILFCLSVCLFVNSFLLGKQWSGSLNKQEFWIFCWHKLILCLVSLSCQLTKLGISIIHSFLPHNAKRGKYFLLLYFDSR